MPPTISSIKQAVADHFGVGVAELTCPSRAAHVVGPRHVAMYLARDLTEHSLPAIGREFGGRDHTTVLYAIRRVRALLGGSEGRYSASIPILRRELGAEVVPRE